MIKVLLVSSLMLLTACSTTTTDSSRDTASTPLGRTRMQNAPGDKTISEVAVYRDACDPQASSQPLEMVVDTKRDTLTLKREGTAIEGFPVFAVASGFPAYTQQSPEKIAPSARREGAILLSNGVVIEASKDATNYRHWRDSRQYSYKTRDSGTLAVKPRQMEKVMSCAKNFSENDIKVTTH